jgi:hypothetical protein
MLNDKIEKKSIKKKTKGKQLDLTQVNLSIP